MFAQEPSPISTGGGIGRGKRECRQLVGGIKKPHGPLSPCGFSAAIVCVSGLANRHHAGGWHLVAALGGRSPLLELAYQSGINMERDDRSNKFADAFRGKRCASLREAAT